MLKLMFLNMSSLIHMAMQRLYFHFQIKYLYLKGSAVYRNKNFCPLCHVWAAFAWILTIHKFWPSVYNVCARRAAELRPVHGDLLHRGPAQDPHRRQEAPGQDQVQQREHLQVGEIITRSPMSDFSSAVKRSIGSTTGCTFTGPSPG